MTVPTLEEHYAMGRKNLDGCDLMTHSEKSAYRNMTRSGTVRVSVVPTRDL